MERMGELYKLPKEIIIKILLQSQVKSLDLSVLDKLDIEEENIQKENINCQYVFNIGVRRGMKCNLWDCQFHKPVIPKNINISLLKSKLENNPELLLNILDLLFFLSKFHETIKCPFPNKCENCADDYIYFEKIINLADIIRKNGVL